MKRSKTIKQIIVLPADFQEVVIIKEMKFNNGDRNIELIRELLYLYSIGMEYYDSINNTILYSHYSQKNTGMITHPEVVEILDKYDKSPVAGSKLELFKNDNPYKFVSGKKRSEDIVRKTLFKQTSLFSNNEKNDEPFTNNYESFMRGEYVRNGHDSDDDEVKGKNLLARESTITNFQRTQRMTFKDQLKSGVQNEFSKLENNLTQVETKISTDIDVQKSDFEQRKKLKMDRLKTKQRKSRTFMIRRGSKLDEILIAVVAHGNSNNNNTEIEQNEILKGIMELSEKKMEKEIKTNQIIMMKEIEDFIEKNMAEMHKALDELRISFEDEIKNVDSELFPDLVKGLKDDMNNDLENLKDQYEEQRREGVEKIKAKYNKRKSLLI